MAKFRKKPVVIEAMHYDGSVTSALDIREWAGCSVGQKTDELCIHTPEGTMNVSRGDWVIRGIKGEFYPCKPDIFAATYEAV